MNAIIIYTCRFDQCAISPLSLKGVKDAGYEKMTVVQEATLPVILKGADITLGQFFMCVLWFNLSKLYAFVVSIVKSLICIVDALF